MTEEAFRIVVNAARVWSSRHGIRSEVRGRWCAKHQTWHYLVYPQGSWSGVRSQ